MYSGERRFFLIEAYDLCVDHSPAYSSLIEELSALGDAWDDMPDFPTRPCWYDAIRPVCIAKAPSTGQDDLAIQRFLDALDLFIGAEQAMPKLGDGDRKRKWRLNKGYADRLVDEGGVSTDLFTQALGAENTRRFFDEAFFAPVCYR